MSSISSPVSNPDPAWTGSAPGACRRGRMLKRAILPCSSLPILAMSRSRNDMRLRLSWLASMPSRPQPASTRPGLQDPRIDRNWSMCSEPKSSEQGRRVRTALFPPGCFRSRTRGGLIHRIAGKSRSVLGGRLAAALEHAHLLVFSPRDANPAAIRVLLEAGWSNTAIVTLSQLVAFLCFQIRTIAGLRTLGASLGHGASFSAKAS